MEEAIGPTATIIDRIKPVLTLKKEEEIIMANACILCGNETSDLLCGFCFREFTYIKPCEKHKLLHLCDEECPACKLEEELKITRRGAAISSLGQLAANRAAAKGSR